jgi:hypothetical protein
MIGHSQIYPSPESPQAQNCSGKTHFTLTS